MKFANADWYHKLDVHAPLVILPMLADELEMKFPEASLRGQAASAWYEGSFASSSTKFTP